MLINCLESQEFVEKDVKWAHLDIAGTAYARSADSILKGATGFGVGLLVEWLRSEYPRLQKS